MRAIISIFACLLPVMAYAQIKDPYAERALWPVEVQLVSNQSLTIMQDGKPLGIVTVKAGTVTPLLSVSNETLVIRYASALYAIPISSTDFSNRIAMAREKRREWDIARAKQKEIDAERLKAASQPQKKAFRIVAEIEKTVKNGFISTSWSITQPYPNLFNKILVEGADTSALAVGEKWVGYVTDGGLVNDAAGQPYRKYIAVPGGMQSLRSVQEEMEKESNQHWTPPRLHGIERMGGVL